MFNIFNEVSMDKKNFYKFEKVGDQLQGTYIGRTDHVPNQFGQLQTIVDIKTSTGEVFSYGIRESKEWLIKLLDGVSFGQIIGFKFDGTKPSKIGSNPTHLINLYADKKFVDVKWLEEQEKKRKDLESQLGSPLAPVTPAPVAVPTVTTEEIKLDDQPFLTTPEKVKKISELARTKLGAYDEATIKAKVMEATKLAFISINLDQILDRLIKL